MGKCAFRHRLRVRSGTAKYASGLCLTKLAMHIVAKYQSAFRSRLQLSNTANHLHAHCFQSWQVDYHLHNTVKLMKLVLHFRLPYALQPNNQESPCETLQSL